MAGGTPLETGGAARLKLALDPSVPWRLLVDVAVDAERVWLARTPVIGCLQSGPHLCLEVSRPDGLPMPNACKHVGHGPENPEFFTLGPKQEIGWSPIDLRECFTYKTCGEYRLRVEYKDPTATPAPPGAVAANPLWAEFQLLVE